MAINVTPLQIIHERLNRADECIKNLDAEIRHFLESSEYPFIPQENCDVTLEAVNYHRNREIPARFGILSGEIIHHLRSSLDHIAWQLSSEQYRQDHPTAIEFPIFEKRPINGDDRSKYQRKIKGISSPSALKLIENLQPYHENSPLDSKIFIIHKMDIFDKHRAIVVCDSTGQAEIHIRDIPPEVVEKHLAGEDVIADIYARVKKFGKVTPQISFEYPARRPRKPIIAVLQDLANAVRDVVEAFSDELS